MLRKSMLLIILLSGLSKNAFSQLELKTFPIALLFEVIPIDVEYGFKEDLSVDGSFLGVLDEGVLFDVGVRYYFNPSDKKCDKFFVAGFLGGGTDYGLGPGFGTGYKWLSRRNLIFEIGIGVGRAYGSDIEEVYPWGRLHLGYRFGPKAKE